MLVLIYEDRPSAFVGVQLAALSLAEHSPGLAVRAIVPGAPDEMVRWAAKIPSLELVTSRAGIDGESWNVKPSVLLSALAEGHDDVMWFDSDMVVTGDLAARLDRIPTDTVVSTEEYFWGHAQGTDARTTGLGLEVARTFPATVNTCLLRVSRRHLPLVEHWRRILASDEYLSVIWEPATRRPLHFGSDLHVFTGLLGSTLYADVPVVQLRRGREIAQCYGPSGWTVAERWHSRNELPLVLHAMGAKPWEPAQAPTRGPLRQRAHAAYEAVHQDLTPYVAAARAYRGRFLGDDGWLEPRTSTARVLQRLHRSPSLQELPLAAVDSAQRRLRRALTIGQMGAR
ncbi:hypothetical protein [Nocardioides sp. P5_E3]